MTEQADTRRFVRAIVQWSLLCFFVGWLLGLFNGWIIFK